MEALLLMRVKQISEPLDAGARVEVKLQTESYGPPFDDYSGELYMRVPKGTRLLQGDTFAVRVCKV